MLCVKANIKLYKGDHFRQTPFISGYRPQFNFITDMKKSGQINLIGKKQFKPGEDGAVEIHFIDNSFLGSDFGKGKKFTFGEGSHILGEGEVIDFN